MEETAVALTSNPGDLVSIPCRACGKRLIPFVIQTGTHLLLCPDCHEKTRVTVTRESGRWRIRTSGP